MSSPGSPAGGSGESADEQRRREEAQRQRVADAEKLATLRYEQATKVVSGQRDSLNELRSRAGLLISAATISTAFLGSVGTKGKHGFPLEFLWAFVPFGLSLIGSLVIICPLFVWKFDLDSGTYSKWGGQPIDKVMEQIAGNHEVNINHNDLRLKALNWLFIGAGVAVLCSVFAWIAIIE